MKTSVLNFNEHLFLEEKKLEKDDATNALVKIAVLNKGFFKGDVIG